MKRSFFIIPFLVCLLGCGLKAARAGEGIYLSAADFASGKVSFENNLDDSGYKLNVHGVFDKTRVKIIVGGSVRILDKDSVFGYRDKHDANYRFVNKDAYKILNAPGNLLLYSKTSLDGGHKNRHVITGYYFSRDENAAVYELTKENLIKVFYTDLRFTGLLDVYFHNDNELTAYDSRNNKYIINYLFETSNKQ